MSVFKWVCIWHLKNDASQWTRDLWSKGVTIILEFRKKDFLPELCNDFWHLTNIFFLFFGSPLLYIVGKLPRTGSGALAICLSDRRQVTCDRWQGICFILIFLPIIVGFVMVLVLQIVHVKRCSVSCMQDFIYDFLSPVNWCLLKLYA